MGAINVIITASSAQTVPGIPNTITISTSEPCTVFYTLTGKTPNSYSPIYVAPIMMPQNLFTVTLNVLAINGYDSSGVIETIFTAIISEIVTQAGDRVPHAAVTNLGNSGNINSLYPFGERYPDPNFQYLNTGDAGTTVYDESKPATSAGFDGSGAPAVFSNKPYDDFEFKQVYSTTNYENEVTPGVGNLPATVTVIGSQYPIEYRPETSSNSDKIFNPRALVINLNSATADPTNPEIIMRQNFSLEDQEIVRDGNLLFNSSLDSPPTMGGFVRSFHNPRTNMISSYFYDNTVNRWIINTTPFQPTSNRANDLSGMVRGRNQGHGLYFKWFSFLGRSLI